MSADKLSRKKWVGFTVIMVFFIVAALKHTEAGAADDKTIIELWESVQPPDPVEIKAVTIDPKTTAFLILDIEQRTCNAERRPRCISSVSKIKKFMDIARSKGVAIVYSLTPAGAPETILPEVVPAGNEPVVKSSVDKFFNTDLEKVLREKNIKTVIIAGTAAEGAVMHTATGAAMRGFQVIVPVDGMSSAALYAEQYTAWHLVNAPGTRNNASLSRFDMIGF